MPARIEVRVVDPHRPTAPQRSPAQALPHPRDPGHSPRQRGSQRGGVDVVEEQHRAHVGRDRANVGGQLLGVAGSDPLEPRSRNHGKTIPHVRNPRGCVGGACPPPRWEVTRGQRRDDVDNPRADWTPAYRDRMAISLDPHLIADLSSGSAAPGGGSIWRDRHIQRQLLAAHLDRSTAAATRSPQAVRRTIDLLTAGLAPGASVLDLGCGPGIYAQQMADDGFVVTGVDFNRASIEYARQHVRGRVRYVEADYTRDLPAGPFDLAMLIYLDFGTHLPEVQRALLREVRRRLRPGGRLVLDYLDAAAADRHRPGRSWEASVTGGFWAPGPHLVLNETTAEPQALAQRIRYTLLTEGEVRRFDVWEHCFADDTIHSMLAEAGFTEMSLHRGVLAGVDPQADDVTFAVATR